MKTLNRIQEEIAEDIFIECDKLKINSIICNSHLACALQDLAVFEFLKSSDADGINLKLSGDKFSAGYISNDKQKIEVIVDNNMSFNDLRTFAPNIPHSIYNAQDIIDKYNLDMLI